MRYGLPAHASLPFRARRAGALSGVPFIRFNLPLGSHTRSFPIGSSYALRAFKRSTRGNALARRTRTRWKTPEMDEHRSGGKP